MPSTIGNITIKRGDSYPLTVWIKNSGTQEPVDITGKTFLLTVNSDKNPIDTTTQIFQLTGVVDPDQVVNKGKVTFTPTILHTATVGKFYYDIQMTDGAYIYTITSTYSFEIVQDITK